MQEHHGCTHISTEITVITSDKQCMTTENLMSYCHFGECRKLIGARYFYKGYLAHSQNFSGDIIKSPRDNIGHGSHTLSTAAGAFVTNASYFGYANGTAKGGSPRARVAAYKVCYMNGCDESDVLAAFDKAIHDRVDVLSLSLGGMQRDYFEDSLAIGAFHAVLKGIPVVCSAGNDGPFPGSVTNVAPWILTVGASTVDREFPSYLLYNRTRVMVDDLNTHFN